MSSLCAVALTHGFWPFIEYTPFMFGFGAVILTSHFAGSAAGFAAVATGLIGYAFFPPPLPPEAVTRSLVGFVIISGTFSWLVARHRDIEAELRSSQKRLTEAQELAHVGNWDWDLEHNQLFWSDELYRIFGVDDGFQVSYSAFLELIHPDDRSLIERSVEAAVRERKPYSVEHRVVRPDGDVRWLNGIGRVVENDTGRVVGMIGTAADITDRKSSEEIVSRSERRLQTVIDAQPACVKLVSHDGALLEMNRAGLQMVEAADASEVVGRPVVELVHLEDREDFVRMHSQASNGVAARSEFRIVGLKGTERHVDSHMVPFDVSMDSDAAPAVLSVTSDITERKHLEAQLRQAHKMEAVGLLAGGIAHDFNNLLTVISGFTEFALEAPAANEDERRSDLMEVQKAADRAAALTRQLLAFSRRQILEPKVINLNGLVSDIQTLLHRTLGEDIKLVLNFDAQLEPVRADPGQLEQVLLNLAVNARDAMPKGGELRFTTEMIDLDAQAVHRRASMTPGRYVRLTVTDTGSGMSREVQQHMFEPFFTTKERNKGTGLGLATVYGIVKQSGGFVWVTSQVGLGTSFEIYLPVVNEPLEQLVRIEQSAAVRGGTETILLVEDDGAVRRLVRMTLQHHGYTVLEARDGEEALQVARGDRHRDIHLLITDVVMPGLSGRELALQIAAERPEIRTLYMSGYAEAVTMRAGLESGTRLLAKPFLPGDLALRVRDTLDASSRRFIAPPVKVRRRPDESD